MRKTIIIFSLISLLVLGLALQSCERDDLCSGDTLTTASIIIRLYDFSNEESTKNVFGLRVQGVGNEEVLEGYNVVTKDSLVLPLKTQATTTQYKLHKDYEVDDNGTPDVLDDDILLGNEDIITIAYQIEEVYVSRACGYKTIFKNIGISVNDDGDNWILATEILNDTIENEITAHVKIRH